MESLSLPHLALSTLGHGTKGLQEMCLDFGHDEMPVSLFPAAASNSSRQEQGQQQDQHGVDAKQGVQRALIKHVRREDVWSVQNSWIIYFQIVCLRVPAVSLCPRTDVCMQKSCVRVRSSV